MQLVQPVGCYVQSLRNISITRRFHLFSSVKCHQHAAHADTGFLVEDICCNPDQKDSMAAAAFLKSLLEELGAQPDFLCLPALNLGAS